MSFPEDENLLNMLVEETFEGPKGPQEMISYRVTYHSSIQCYQLEVDEKVYTFPSNWGPFIKVHEREGNGLVMEDDLELINSIFGSLVGLDVKSAFIFKDTETYLVFVPANMEINIDDLHSLLDNDSDFKLAA